MSAAEPKQSSWTPDYQGRDKEIVFTREGKIAILKKLIEAQGFEAFLHRRFPGTKRFGLDGAEAMVRWRRGPRIYA